MATKLKNLNVKKVDFVDAGANPDAHIKLFKRADIDDKADSTDDSDKKEGIMKKLFGFLGSIAKMSSKEFDEAIEIIEKGDSVSFGEKYIERQNSKIADEIWDLCYALQSSLCSILCDEDLDNTGVATAMQESINEFQTVMEASVKMWSERKLASISKKEEVTDADIEFMKSAVNRLNDSIEKATAASNVTKNLELEGENVEMRIDKSKMTDAEKAFLESIEKRYGIEEGSEPVVDAATNNPTEPTRPEPSVTKNVEQPTATEPDDNIYKGLHPAVAAELESLKKFKQDAEDRELAEVAKKYAIIGKKQEELVPVLKNLRLVGGTAYDDMIAVLDQTVETVEKSGVFSEIGKCGHSDENSVEAKVEGIAKKYMEAEPGLSRESAIAKAWENNPDLLSEYDETEGF